MTGPEASWTERLVCVVSDAETCLFVARRSGEAAIDVAAIAELIRQGHTDLAFDLLCEACRKRSVGQRWRRSGGRLDG